MPGLARTKLYHAFLRLQVFAWQPVYSCQQDGQVQQQLVAEAMEVNSTPAFSTVAQG